MKNKYSEYRWSTYGMYTNGYSYWRKLYEAEISHLRGDLTLKEELPPPEWGEVAP